MNTNETIAPLTPEEEAFIAEQEKLATVSTLAIAKLELKPTDVVIVQSDRITMDTVQLVARALTQHLGFPVAVLLMSKDDNIKVMSAAEAPRIYAP